MPRTGMLVTFVHLCASSTAWPENHVLSLGGDGDFLEVDNSELLGNPGSQITLEAWIRAEAFPLRTMFLFYKGDEIGTQGRHWTYTLSLSKTGALNLRWGEKGSHPCYSEPGLVVPGQWYHVAGIIDSESQTAWLFLNGREITRRTFDEHIVVSSSSLWIGATHESGYPRHGSFCGQMAEVRVWQTARTEDQIRQTLHQRLSGKEPELVGLWNFASQDASDATGNHNGKFVGNAHCIPMALPGPEELVPPVVVAGTVRDEEGKLLPETELTLWSDNRVVAQTQSALDGNYHLVLWEEGTYDLQVTHNLLGIWCEGVAGQHDQLNRQDLVLVDNVSIEGRALMLDHETPHVALVVQAVTLKTTAEPDIVATALSDPFGCYHLVNLRPGAYCVRCYTPEGCLYYVDRERIGAESEASVVHVAPGKTTEPIDLHFSRIKRGTWSTYTAQDGLASDMIFTGLHHPDGKQWFATANGITQFDGNRCIDITPSGGLPFTWVTHMDVDHQGRTWLGSWWAGRPGLAYIDGDVARRVTFPTDGGQFNERVLALHCGPNGKVWFGTWGGLYYYEDGEVHRLTAEDGLPGPIVLALHTDRRGDLWVGMPEGLARYDGERFHLYSVSDGLAGRAHHFVGGACSAVGCIHETHDGVLWFGTGWWSFPGAGVSWYDGKARDGKLFQTFTTKDGLASDIVGFITSDREGNMWFGTGHLGIKGNGASRYNGEGFVNFTVADGLAANAVTYIHCGGNGEVWFGTQGTWLGAPSGISRYDESSMTHFTAKDGLAGNVIRDICGDTESGLWLATDRGVSHYDGKHFTALANIPGDEHPIGDVLAIRRSADDTIWALARGKGLLHIAGTITCMPIGVGGLYSFVLASNGTIWVGSDWGLMRLDSQGMRIFGKPDGLAPEIIGSLHEDRNGVLWVGTENGLYRYNGNGFEPVLTVETGLANSEVLSVHTDTDGTLWLGTLKGLTRWDGTSAQTFTEKDGLAHSSIHAIHRASSGILCVGTDVGISFYDGITWASLTGNNGLPAQKVLAIHEHVDGSLWLGTDQGLVHYARGKSLPHVNIDEVIVGESYADLNAIPAIHVGQRITVRCSSRGNGNTAQPYQYRFRVQNREHWSPPSRSRSFDYTFTEPGTHEIQVQSIDRDLNYSEPAPVALHVVVPLHQRTSFLIPTLGGAGILAAASIGLGFISIQRRRQLRTYERLAAQELQQAREVQHSLLPKQLPQVNGFQFAATCQPANTVGGDLYTYLWLDAEQTRLLLVLMDVAGHGMHAAGISFLTHGMLQSEAMHHSQTESIMQQMHERLRQQLRSNRFVAASFLEIDIPQRRLTHYNAGCPLPLLVRESEVTQLSTQGGLPFGTKLPTQYVGNSVTLQSGDRLVLFSDGLTEAVNSKGEMYGIERVHSVLSELSVQDGSAQDWLDGLLEHVQRHKGSQNRAHIPTADTHEQDDVTLIVIITV